MSKRQRYVVAAVVSNVSVGMLWACWIEFRPRPDLSRATALADAKRFDEADAIIRAYLVQEPGSNKARMLAAQLALMLPTPAVSEGELPDPKPALLALDDLLRIRPEGSYLASLVELYKGKAEFRLGRLDAAELVRAAPSDHRFQYRLIRRLLNSGATAEAEPLERGYRAYLKAKDEAGPLYDEANGIKTLGLRPHPGPYQRIADLRERMGLPDDALAWHRLVLRDDPLNRTSLAKVEQLSRSPENPSAEGSTKQEHSSRSRKRPFLTPIPYPGSRT